MLNFVMSGMDVRVKSENGTVKIVMTDKGQFMGELHLCLEGRHAGSLAQMSMTPRAAAAALLEGGGWTVGVVQQLGWAASVAASRDEHAVTHLVWSLQGVVINPDAHTLASALLVVYCGQNQLVTMPVSVLGNGQVHFMTDFDASIESLLPSIRGALQRKMNAAACLGRHERKLWEQASKLASGDLGRPNPNRTYQEAEDEQADREYRELTDPLMAVR